MAKTFLTIDDSPCIRHLVAMTLKGAGHTVIEASNGLDGYTEATRNRVDGIFVDLNMPVMNGLEFLRKFRGDPASRGVPVILLTSQSDIASQEEARDAGATGWMMKPFDPATLLRVIK